MKLHNVMEEVVEAIFYDEVLNNHSLKCSCDQCKVDILSLTLNHLPSKYVSSKQGEVLSKLSIMDKQFKLDVVKEIMRSILQIENKPRHEYA